MHLVQILSCTASDFNLLVIFGTYRYVVGYRYQIWKYPKFFADRISGSTQVIEQQKMHKKSANLI